MLRNLKLTEKVNKALNVLEEAVLTLESEFAELVREYGADLQDS